MAFVSYAQNGEDVLLWRAFRDVGTGFYVDVGAWHPDEDSVTRAFYDRGWRGINIEAAPEMAERVAAARPRDVTLAVAAGAADGAATLHRVAGTGLSTIDADTAELLPGAGFEADTIDVPVRRLDGILAAHAAGAIHFLKVDVEGAERAVLEGCDFGRFRPQVVLVEATRPLSSVPTHEGWEHLLTGAGYRFTFFDGLNRFYVAEEHAGRLAACFATPVNVLDGYVRAADAAWARAAAEQEGRVREALGQVRDALRQAGAAEEQARAAYARGFEQAREAGSLRVRLEAAEGGKAEAERRMLAADAWGHACDARRLEAEARAAELSAALEAQAAERAALLEALDARERLLRAFEASTSWQLTRPVRALSGLVRPRGEATPRPPVPGLPAVLPPPEEPTPMLPEVESPSPPVPEPASPAAAASETPRRQPGTLRAVHQFHSGSATGDAVTNSMLLVRRLLRAEGYRSEIFVEHVDPALSRELRPLSSLPGGGDHVLIVHHSMGHDALERVLGGDAPVILFYHNITPAELLPPFSGLQHYARLGREQLERIRGRAVAALADSEFNAIELRRAGFAAVRACSLLFDLDALRADGGVRAEGGPFTVLFVGRVTESKGQADLVDAFAAFAGSYGRPARLVLVGRTDGPGDYLRVIDERMRGHGVVDAVTLTGAVSDAELAAWYRAADLYVSLSWHEGFGVPLAEAVARGAPVLAWGGGAVPYTLGDEAGLLRSREAAAVGRRILELAEDGALRAGLLAGQRAALGRFALSRQWPAMQEALARAGAVGPADAAARAALAGQMRFTVEGHAQGSYSLAAVNRGLAGAIEAERPGRVRLVPVEGVRATDFSALAPEARGLVERAGHPSGPQVVISQHYPIHVPPERGDVALALVFWEESLLPGEMIETLAAGFDAVLAPSRFVAKALLDSGLPLPVRVVGQAPALGAFEALGRERRRRDGGAFTFLHVSSCFPRKGVDVLLAAYARAFRRGDAVRLVIKGFPNPHNTVPEQVATLQAADPELAPIEVIDRDLHAEAMLGLFRRADAMVLPTRGEGLNLPAAEAMAAGTPLIVTGIGGHMDFVDGETARLLDYRLAPSRSHLATAHSLWAEPDEDDLVAALREIEATRRDAAAAAAWEARTARAREQVGRRLGAARMVERIEGAALDVLLRGPREPLQVAWVTSWGVRCGVAEYSRHLLGAMREEAEVSHAVLWDDRMAAEGRGGVAGRPVWDLARAEDVRRFEAAVAAEDPRAVVFQHQPGLIPWAALPGWLGSTALGGRVVVATLHNTRDLDDLAGDLLEAVRGALARADRVVVHTERDLARLRRLGLAANVALFPHGAREGLPVRAAAAVGNAPLIGCYGFFLPGKGVGRLIEAVASLRRGRPGVRLRLVNAEYDGEGSREEIAACRALAAAAGLETAIEWETGFLDDDESLGLLSECDVVVLPTQASKEASSAAVRMALASGAPVLTTPLPLYDDVGAAVVRSAGSSAAELADGIEALLGDVPARSAAQRAAQSWLGGSQWPLVARRFLGMVKGLCASE